ncbi:type IA DNA topoisomerase [Wenyingzhuangia aestuarii]|uniref:type IA DNA topoisomerase n=1 Tax=Wenyingzhuangia aestuarii TaxID=1647582 RepID=UPI0014391D51|nr:type IA DNA topoisomerase [Wenyingzhuangia aestuarii]NJB82453.1 DNA topoisomerase-3 [Wenyingzhuangia aestuarii]
MKVCIAEKPSVAKEIASVLGANVRCDGYFEGNGYQVTWTFGHLCGLFAPHEYKPHWKSWNLDTLPMLPERFEVKVMEDKGVQKQFRTIKFLFDKAAVVINCGDAGTEGELIQRWVINQAGYKGKVERLWISSLTTEAIKEGFEKLIPAEKYDNLYYAASSRAIGDWLLGMNATRLYTLKYGRDRQVLSIGRVQTPTLAMVVHRFLEIQNFKPQPYWEIQTLYRDTVFNNEQGRYLKKEDGEQTMELIKGKPLEIVSVEKKKGKEYAPKLFDLTGLQVYCNNKFGFTADETLKITQGLYEKKVVTYPRVDTTFLPNDVYPKVRGILSKLTQYARLTAPVLAEAKIKKSTKVFNDKKVTDHHAIIPTGIEEPLHANAQKVYDIITRRFIAVFYPDSDVSNTTVLAEVEKIGFKTTGKEILSEGWRVVFKTAEQKEAAAKKADEEVIMPTFVKGESGEHEPSFLEKETKPPKQYTEATLLRAMETAGKQVKDDELRDLMKENGIGRPSTRANIIETLFKRNYIERNKKQILPTSTGIQLISTIQNKLLKSARLTGEWEKQLKDIEKGTYNAATFINNMKKMVDDLVVEVRLSNHRPIVIDAVSKTTVTAAKKQSKGIMGMECPKCKQGHLLKGSKAYGCSKYNENCDFVLPFEFQGKKISENQFTRLLSKGSTVNLKGFVTQEGKKDGAVVFNDAFQLMLKTKEVKVTKVPEVLTCPKCKKGTILKGSSAYGCSNYKAGCDFKMEFTTIKSKAGGKELTKALVWELLNS